MSCSGRYHWPVACVACLALGWLCGNRDLRPAKAEPAVVTADRAVVVKSLPFPMTARLGSNLYLQASAEYRACCRQIYRCAGDRLAAIVKTAPRGQSLAVVMDLDETVFDNSAFQTYLLRNGLEYSEQRWDQYEANFPQDVTPIPGALDFIREAGNLGVRTVFISNRSERFRDSTKSVLERFGLGIVPEERLLLKQVGGSSDKTARRKIAATRFQVLMYVGDNLRDFSEEFVSPRLPQNPSVEDYRSAIAARAAAVDKNSRWGADWFVLPNPVYGEWDKLAGPDPVSLLHPTSMKP